MTKAGPEIIYLGRTGTTTHALVEVKVAISKKVLHFKLVRLLFLRPT
jgi:hypothetical protein